MGGLLLVVGLAVLAFGLWNHLKGKRILAAPFKKTGEIAKNPVSPDPKGAMSTEGKVIAPAQALLSPCSKQPCLYYEVKVERIYEKTETTQDGTKTVKGTETLDTVKGGTMFGLDDGSGQVNVDFSKGADVDMKEGFKKELNGRSWASNIQFGEFSYDVPPISSSDSWTIGFKATEKYVPADGNLFVLGKLEGASIVKPGWRSMMASNKGREGLLGSIQKKKKFSFIGGGIAAVLSIPLMIWGPQPDPNAVSAYCESSLTDARQKCSDNVSSESGEEYAWTLTKPGEYELEVFAPAKKIPFYPQIIVKDAQGEEVANAEGGVGENAKATVKLEAGAYTVVVKPADDYMVKGGFSYDLEIRSLSAPEPKKAAPVAKAKKAAPAPAPAAPAAVEAAPAEVEDEVAAAEPAPEQAAEEEQEEAPEAVAAPGCAKLTGVQTCKSKLLNGAGSFIDLKIVKAGKYEITAHAMRKQGEDALDPHLTITNAGGEELAAIEGEGPGGGAVATLDLEPGSYRLLVADMAEHVGPKGSPFALAVAAMKPAKTAKVEQPKAEPKPAPEPKVAKKLAEKPAPAKQTTVAEAPKATAPKAVAAPAPVEAPKPAPMKKSNKNLED